MIGPFSGSYRFLSNFWPEAARGGFTNEHFFQAAKTLDPGERATVMATATAGQAKRAGRAVTLRSDWEQVKEDVMREHLRAKFYSDVELAQKLLATGAHELVEVNTWGDRYWGAEEVDGTFIGLNRLGKLLMEVREELRMQRSKTLGIFAS